MKAAVFHGIRDIKTEEVEEPEIQDNEILVRVRACGICGSDLHLYKLNMFSWMLIRRLKKGGIPGHEYSGDIVEVGSKVKGFEEGDRVVALHNGGMAEYVPVPVYEGLNIIKIPSNVTYEDAATLEPLANSYHASLKGEPFKGANIIIFGLGGIGLGVIQCLKALNIDTNKIIAIDLSDYRLNRAKELGADEIFNGKAINLNKKILDIVGTTPSMRVPLFPMPNVDIVYDCVGSVRDQKRPIVLQQAIDLLREGTGRVVVHGIFEDSVNLNLIFMVGKEVTIKGSFAFSREEFEKSLKLIQEEKIDRSKLITHEFPLDRAKEAFDMQCNTDESVKVLIKP
jgi:threonine dehydrogenase-like Zn-dependent dehydrogenase